MKKYGKALLYFWSNALIKKKKLWAHGDMFKMLKKKNYSGEGRYKRLLYRMSAIECRKNDKIM